jgi:hypothetical protein
MIGLSAPSAVTPNTSTSGPPIIVEEPIEEDATELTDARRPVDERHLTQPSCAFVGRQLRAHVFLTGLCPNVDDPSVLEPELKTAHERAWEREIDRGGHDALGACAVWSREDFLGRQVHHVPPPEGRLCGGGEPA